MLKLEDIQKKLRQAAPLLVSYIFDDLALKLIPSEPIHISAPKIVNDVVWNIIELESFEVALLDLPLMQRLRHVRQLGLAYLVYPTAHHTRFEHSIGALHVARIITNHLIDKSGLPDSERKKLKSIIAAAAVLHDCGHSAFSHAGERALQNHLTSEFTGISNSLAELFPDGLSLADNASVSAAAAAGKSKFPAAEIFSVLFVLSPPMAAFVRKFATSTSASITEQDLGHIAAFILGKPSNLITSKVMHRWAKSIISGDLDADKLDYVSRDSMYCGIKTFADVHRIISQLTILKAQAKHFPDDEPKFKRNNIDSLTLLGLKQTGESAGAMFLASRAYLHERVYHHQKIVCAEELLNAAINSHLNESIDPNNPHTITKQISLLFSNYGDDYVLGQIATTSPSLKAKSHCARIVSRDLPIRVLAMPNPLTTDGTGEKSQNSASIAWQTLTNDLDKPIKKSNIEARIRSIAKLDTNKELFLVWRRFQTVSETPDLYLEDPSEPGCISEIRSRFSVEQHVTAYQHNRQMLWVYSERKNIVPAAAATTVMLRADYGLTLTTEALLRAKTSKTDIDAQLNQFLESSTDSQHVDLEIIQTLLLEDNQRPLRLTIRDAARLLPSPQNSDPKTAEKLQQLLNTAFKSAQIFEHDQEHWGITRPVLRALLQISERLHDQFDPFSVAQKRAMRPEDVLQERVVDLLQSQLQHSDIETASTNPSTTFVGEQQPLNGGRVDIYISQRNNAPSNGDPTSALVELKAEKKPLSKIVPAHAGQVIQYLRSHTSRILLTFSAYEDDASQLLLDRLSFRKNTENGTPVVVINVGFRANTSPPSDRGKASSPI